MNTLLVFAAMVAAAQEPAPELEPPAPVEAIAPSYLLPPGPKGELDEARLAALMSAYVQIDTQNPPSPGSFSDAGGRPEWVDFIALNWLEPLGLDHEMRATNLVVRIESDDSRPPIIWLSHADVVPVDEDDLDDWTHPPFDGVVADGQVFGRGVLDNKGSTVMQLEALRVLLESGLKPSRDLLLVVTPDEEAVKPQNGAGLLVASELEALGSPTTVLDEGGYILPDFFEGQIVATVAVAEKTYATMELRVRGPGGHSSMPAEGYPTAVLSQALARIADWETKRTITPEMQESLKRLGASKGGATGFLMQHPRLFKPLLLSSLGGSPAGNAITRNTIAITILDAGVKDNVIPGEASATVNARLLPGQSVDAFIADLKGVIDDDRVEVSLVQEPTEAPAASFETPFFGTISRVIEENVPGAVVIPNVNPGTQDSRFFAAAGLDCYRFIPVVVDRAGRESIHGNDEKLPTAELLRGATIYRALLTEM